MHSTSRLFALSGTLALIACSGNTSITQNNVIAPASTGGTSSTSTSSGGKSTAGTSSSAGGSTGLGGTTTAGSSGVTTAIGGDTSMSAGGATSSGIGGATASGGVSGIGGGTSSGGTSSASTGVGGTIATGGTSSTKATSATGGASVGGAATGGTVAATGGKVAATGGTVAATGGAVAATGGTIAATGGTVAATGGTVAATGGAATGGAATGGAATGGAATGGAATGGAATGGTVPYDANCGKMAVDTHTVALYHFDEGTGQVVNDSSGNSRTAYFGNSTATETVDPTWSKGRFGGHGVSFSRASQQLVHAAQSNTFPNNQLTLEAWIRPVAPYDYSQFLTVGFINGYMNIGWSGQLEGAIGDGNNWASCSSTGNNLNTGTWHYVAMTYSGSAIVLWLDGAAINTCAASTTLASPADYNIGGRNYNTYINGEMDEVRISDVARSTVEITSYYATANACGVAP